MCVEPPANTACRRVVGRWKRSASFTAASMIRWIGVASALFAGKSGLVLLTIDPVLAHAEIRHENLDGGDELFPHIYGSLKPRRCNRSQAVRAATELAGPATSQPQCAASVRARSISARSVSWAVGGGRHDCAALPTQRRYAGTADCPSIAWGLMTFRCS
jgi:uncharacterized protein (DUF952 family)